jgi:hypothetical protein
MKMSLCAMLATVPVLGCLLLFGCTDGKDGDPGPKGANGLDGPDGADGDPGKDGDGFQESTAYGNIVVSFAGKLADGRDFTDSVNFKHAPVGVTGFMIGSLATVSDDFYNFSVRRFYGAVDLPPDLQDNFVHLNLDVIPTEDGNIVIPNECTIHTYMHASATKLVAVQQDFAGMLSVDDFEDCQYNAATGDLSFRLTLKESHQQNDIGISGLKITMVATLKVFQYIDQGP